MWFSCPHIGFVYTNFPFGSSSYNIIHTLHSIAKRARFLQQSKHFKWITFTHSDRNIPIECQEEGKLWNTFTSHHSESLFFFYISVLYFIFLFNRRRRIYSIHIHTHSNILSCKQKRAAAAATKQNSKSQVSKPRFCAFSVWKYL